jgi:hypothetical protein
MLNFVLTTIDNASAASKEPSRNDFAHEMPAGLRSDMSSAPRYQSSNAGN